MKSVKYLYILVLGIVMSSCLDDTAPEDVFGEASNLGSFVSSSTIFQLSASGDEYVRTLPMLIKGPSVDGIGGDVTATIVVDEENTTAVEGVHYRLESTTVTFAKNNDYIANFPVTIITEGIEPPLASNPVLVLKVASVSGGNNVIANGKPITISINYLCFSDLAGDFVLSILRSDNNTVYVRNDEVVNQTGEGEYRGTYVGHYTPDQLGGTPGFTFYDVCNVLTVPEQNLVDLYSNLLYQDGEATADPVTGDLHIEYTVTFAAGNRKYTCDYVRQ